MENIVGRKIELKRLTDYMNSNKAEFLVVYGRRRVGKTYLIKQYFKNQFCFYMSGTENSDKTQQLFNFASALNTYSKKPYPMASSWQEAFLQLKDYLEKIKTKGRKVIFIDELPWLDNPKSGFIQAFEYFWNTYASANKDIFLVVCGSATSWIINKIIKNRGGLHNRVTRQIYLHPFTLGETEEFLKTKKINLPRTQIAECYMIMGGIPYYLDQLEKQYSLAQNIDNLFFKKTGILRDEYSKIYYSLFKTPEKQMQVVETLAKKRKGLSRDEISKYSKISNGGGLSKILEELEQCGFIAINDNFTNIKKNKLYQLTDFFSLFYLHFVKNKKGTNSDYWNSLADNTKHRAWTGFSFELLCQAHLEQIKQALGISGITSYTSGWRSRKQDISAQIDLIIDRNDNIINLCEMKFSNKEFIIDKNYDKILQNKKWAFLEETKTKKAIHITLISTYGIKQNEYWHNIHNELSLQDLFKT